MKKPTSIILHHSLTKDSKTVSWGAIRKYHVEQLGWKDIGYHFGIELVGNDVEVLLGRTLLENGAHTVGRNKDSVGVCVVGNYDQDFLSEKHLSALVKLSRWLCSSLDIPISEIRAHSEFADKTCPGRNFPLQHVRDEVARASVRLYVERTKNID